MAGMNLKLQGYVPANRDATVKLRSIETGQVLERKPFLDGSLLVQDIEPGQWELEVSHPNLIQPIDKRVVRIFRQPQPTFVPVPVPAELFVDTPIRDVPDANLAPVQEAVTAARTLVQPLAAKTPGEAIRASDWNTLAGAVASLSTAVLELTRLVAPTGHDHPEIAEKIGEVQGNLLRFAEAYGRSLLQLRREIETAHLRRTADDVLDLAGADQDTRKRFSERLDDLQLNLQVDSATFTQKLAGAGTTLLGEINTLAQTQGGNPDDFRKLAPVQTLVGKAESYREAGVQVKPEAEMGVYARAAAAGGPPVVNLFGAGKLRG